MLDLLIKNGTVIDGTGKPAWSGNIGIKDGKIVFAASDADAARVIDATGKIVSPGFIDAHSHGDGPLGTESGRLFKTPQGVTTEICGNCGGTRLAVYNGGNPIVEGADFGTFGRMLDYAEKKKKTANIRFYMGHGTLRRSVIGIEDRSPTASEMDKMKALLDEYMQCGCAGITTGLGYVPGCFADTEELIELAKVSAKYGGFYASHMRNESYGVVDAVEETIKIAECSGAKTFISHHKVLGRSNWGLHHRTLELIENANARGVAVTCDQYPYTRNMTTANSIIPPRYLKLGGKVLVERLKDTDFRREVKAGIEDVSSKNGSFYLDSGGWDGILITSSPNDARAVGKTVTEYAELCGKDAWDAYFDLMIANGMAGMAVFDTMRKEDLFDIIRSKYCVVGSDGCNSSWQGMGHPRGSSAFTHAITYYVKENKILTLEEMIRKMTGFSAERLALKGKGFIKEGYDADIVIFDYDALHDPADYVKPNQLTEGIEQVIVNGKVVYENMQLTGECAGRVIRYGRE